PLHLLDRVLDLFRRPFKGREVLDKTQEDWKVLFLPFSDKYRQGYFVTPEGAVLSRNPSPFPLVSSDGLPTSEHGGPHKPPGQSYCRSHDQVRGQVLRAGGGRRDRVLNG